VKQKVLKLSNISDLQEAIATLTQYIPLKNIDSLCYKTISLFGNDKRYNKA